LPSEIIELGLLDGLIERRANSYVYTDLDDKEWKGTYKQFSNFLRKNEELAEELVANITDVTVNESTTEGGNG
jgi:hypothetical protein